MMNQHTSLVTQCDCDSIVESLSHDQHARDAIALLSQFSTVSMNSEAPLSVSQWVVPPSLPQAWLATLLPPDITVPRAPAPCVPLPHPWATSKNTVVVSRMRKNRPRPFPPSLSAACASTVTPSRITSSKPIVRRISPTTTTATCCYITTE
jgi:hypothetical protein